MKEPTAGDCLTPYPPSITIARWAEAGATLTPITAKVIPAKSQFSCECWIFNIFCSPAFDTGIFNQKIVAATYLKF
jgi:hypothetical protein